jgi:hypothetical protein
VSTISVSSIPSKAIVMTGLACGVAGRDRLTSARSGHAERRCPTSGRVWSTFVHMPSALSGSQRSPSGLQREVIRARCRRDPAETDSLGRTLIRMRSQVQVLAVPPTISATRPPRPIIAAGPSGQAARCMPPTSRSPRTQWCDDPHTGLNPRPDGDARNAREQGRPNR